MTLPEAWLNDKVVGAGLVWINPKATYMEHASLSADPHAWYSQAQKHEGSWWPQWLDWIQARSGEQRETRTALGNQDYPPLDAAPGTYVHMR